VVEAITSTQGPSAAYQSNFAAMQQILIQQMFHAADANGNGVISKTEFENFYKQFMGANSTPESAASTKASADQLYQQLNVSGNGLTVSQFASAVKLMMSEKAQGHLHRQGTSAGGTVGSAAPYPSAASAAAKKPATWLGTILASANQDAAGQAAPPQNNGGIEFIA